MTQRRMDPPRLPEGGSLRPVGSTTEEEKSRLQKSHIQQWLACCTATLTMFIVGTINGWSTSSLLYLASRTGDAQLQIGQNQYSWIIYFIVLGTMTGSFMCAQLADRCGRKFCLLVCSGMITAGWIIIYAATSVYMIYIAGTIQGIGIGIARTINPMFVSEVADISIRGMLAVLITVTTYVGTMITCTLQLWLTYETLVLILALTSLIFFLTITRIPETPYFLVAKGRKKQACKAIAYYKYIVDPIQVNIELSHLRAETKYELDPQSRYELHQESRSELPSISKSNLHPQSKSDLSLQLHERLSDLVQQVDTEPMSNLPSSSHSSSISIINSEVFRDIYQRPTGELRQQASPESFELALRPSPTLHSQFASEIQRPSTSEIQRPSTSEIQRPSTSEIQRPSTNEMQRPSTSEMQRPSTSEIQRPSTSEIQRPSTSEIHRPSTSEIQRPSTSEIQRPSTSEMQRPSTSEIQRPSTSEIQRPSTSEIQRPSTSEIHRPSTSGVHRPSTSKLNKSSSSDLYPLSTTKSHRSSTSAIISEPRFDLPPPARSVPVYMDQIHMNGTLMAWFNKLRVITGGSNKKALFIMIGLIVAQVLGEHFFTMNYPEKLYKKINMVRKSYQATLVVQFVNFLSSSFIIFTVGSVGRRLLLILSTLGTSFTLSVLGHYLGLAEEKLNDPIFEFLVPIVLILYQITFQIGLGTIPTVLLCELFPTELKGIIGAILILSYITTEYLVALVKYMVIDSIGAYAFYHIIAALCTVAFLIVFIWMPETKGKTYNEIAALLLSKNSNSSNEKSSSDESNIQRP